MSKERVGHKPGSVPIKYDPMGGVIYLGRLLPNASSGSPTTERGKDQPLPLRPCFPPGFTEPAPHDAAGALLPHLCTLTFLRESPKKCGIFLWHYPHAHAHWALPSKFGL